MAACNFKPVSYKSHLLKLLIVVNTVKVTRSATFLAGAPLNISDTSADTQV